MVNQLLYNESSSICVSRNMNIQLLIKTQENPSIVTWLTILGNNYFVFGSKVELCSINSVDVID